MFKCKACEAKQSHIEDLRKQIADLRTLALPKQDASVIPLVQLEADAVLSGTTDVIQVNTTDPQEDDAEAIQSEASRILAGTY